MRRNGPGCRRRPETPLRPLHEEHVNSPHEFVSVSVGAASALPSLGGSATQLVRQADQSLYKAKRNGRNRVDIAPAGTPVGS
ncbi:diguanylate cyclase domain-containing protein [Actinoplanes sp. KI2]|uniref:diguanylate cyclase domain-containing protein n=1 Tax=Actinoplanes sp. KI2 TaxID=2983315 RepID=UPI003983B7EB